MMSNLPNWTQAVQLHPDVESGKTALALYAIDLGALVRGDSNVPLVYRQARNFFAATHLTPGLKQLLEDVLARLAGTPGNRVLQLRSAFGGGKSHSLAALYHAATDYSTLRATPGGESFSDPGVVRVAAFDGEKFDVLGGEVKGQRVKTLWGSLAAQLGSHEKVRYHDENRVAPGGDVIRAVLGDAPTLILMDEVLKYVERAGAEKVGDSTLGRQTQDFLQSLSVEAAGTDKAVMIYSLQASEIEAFGDAALLNMLDHLTSRVDAKREPVTMADTLPVLRKRLLDGEPNPAIAHRAGEAYARLITQTRRVGAASEAERMAADHDRMNLQDRFQEAYPFHPELIHLMRERWASLPNFQRTRGALRFLAICLHALHKSGQAGDLLGPGDIPLEYSEVQQAFFSEVGQREPFQSVLERDFFGPNARVKRIDAQMSAEDTELTGVHPALRLATAILMYSFGGRTTANLDEGEPIAVGVTESELLSAVVSPDLNSITAQAALNQLKNQCLYLHFDGVHYAFKTTPNITQVLEDWASRVDVQKDIDPVIQAELVKRLEGRAVIIWPKESQRIANKEPRFLLAYLPLDFAALPPAQQNAQARELLTQYGDQPRQYRNGIGLAIPNSRAVADLRESQKYLIAIDRVNKQRQSLGLTTAQLAQLKDREKAASAERESAFRTLYESVWLPKLEGQALRPGSGQALRPGSGQALQPGSGHGIGLEKVDLAGRALAAQTIHERLIELLKISPPHLFSTVTPEKILDLMRLGMGTDSPTGVRISAIVDSFYSSFDFPRLENSTAIRAAVAEGVQRGLFGYIGRAGLVDERLLREASGYEVEPSLVRIGVDLEGQQIDEGSGLIVLPQSIRPVTPPEPQPGPEVVPGTGPTTAGETAGGVPPDSALTPSSMRDETVVRLKMRMNRGQIYAATQALANLAQQAGEVEITVEAAKYDGFDPQWLQNAVLEPLDEADVRVERE